METVNVIGLLPGAKAEWKDQSAILSAHYDHLGLGWPDVHKGDEGRAHPGADDNASGVAVMLELAKALKASGSPSRTLIFAAFSAEEAGLKVRLRSPSPPAPQSDHRRHQSRHGGPARRGQDFRARHRHRFRVEHIFRGAGFVTGVESRLIPESMQSSDQMSFIRRLVPAIQLFTTVGVDYHRPTDTADKIDAAGLVKVAAFAREGIAYLGERPTPLTNTIPAAATPELKRSPPRDRPTRPDPGPTCELRNRSRLRLPRPRSTGGRRRSRLTRGEGGDQGRRRDDETRRH